MSCDSTKPTSQSHCTSTTAAVIMNHTEEEEEAELGIYSDNDDSAGDLSDDEPPITEQDTSGRPQSQFKLRVTSAIARNNHLMSEAQAIAMADAGRQTPPDPLVNHIHIDCYELDEDESDEGLTQELLELQTNQQAIPPHRRLLQRQQDQDLEQQSNRAKEPNIK